MVIVVWEVEIFGVVEDVFVCCDVVVWCGGIEVEVLMCGELFCFEGDDVGGEVVGLIDGVGFGDCDFFE